MTPSESQKALKGDWLLSNTRSSWTETALHGPIDLVPSWKDVGHTKVGLPLYEERPAFWVQGVETATEAATLCAWASARHKRDPQACTS